jgi:hypothetical protein
LRYPDSNWTENPRSPTLRQALALGFLRSQLVGAGHSSSPDLFVKHMNDCENASDGKSGYDGFDDHH